MIIKTRKLPVVIPWAVPVIVCALLTGCTTTGLYGRNSRRLDTGIRAVSAGDFAGARLEFSALADQTDNPDAVAAGQYGLICISMAAAADIPSFMEALETLSRFPDPQRFGKQNPMLLLAGVENGIRLMEKREAEQAGQIHRLLEKNDKAGQQNEILEQSLKDLKYQLRELERIDRDLQEKRNPS